MSHDSQGRPWERYQAVAADLLNRFATQFGLDRVEGKQKIRGEKSTWEIDAKGMRDSDGAVILVECRRKKRKLDQEALAAIAYRIQDIGAQGGIVVSPLKLQSGAKRIANAESIIEVQLDQDSTSLDFAMRFLGKLMAGACVQDGVVAGDKIDAEASRPCSFCGKRFPLVDYNQRHCQQCKPN
jgi:Restriction endonuclease